MSSHRSKARSRSVSNRRPFTSEFGRGRLDDLVALLSGRNFETREFEEVIAEASFPRLEAAVLRFMKLPEDARSGAQPLQSDRELRRDAEREQYGFPASIDTPRPSL